MSQIRIWPRINTKEHESNLTRQNLRAFAANLLFSVSPCLRGRFFRRMLQVPQAARIETMKTERCLLALIFAMVLPGTLLAQAGRRAAPPPKTADKCLLKENINEDIAAQVAKFKLVSMK